MEFTEREWDVMRVLWRRGSATVAEVKEEISSPLAYTTVLTVLRILEQKGRVAHAEEGRAHRYFPLVGTDAAHRGALKRFRDKVFGGSYDVMFTNLVRDREIPDDDLRRLWELVEQRLRESGE
jgi:BlaI family transcriptional regulator, penicillinase repressor